MAHLPHRLPILVILGLGLGLGLTGCLDQPQPTPTPSPVATTPAAAAPIECDAVLGSDGYAKLAEDGLEPVEPQLFDPLAIRLEEAGGTACAWGLPQSDVGLTLVQLPVPDADWAGWEAALAEASYVEGGDAASGAYAGPVDPGTGLSTIAVVSGDRITFLSTAAFAGLLAPHAI